MVRTPVKGQAVSSGKAECRKGHADGSLSLWIVLFRDVMGALVLKIRCTDIRIRREERLVRLTFTGDREEYQAAWFADICSQQILDEIDVRSIAALANAGDQAFSNTFSSTANKKE